MIARNMVKAVGYARRSTDMQERSIPDQQARDPAAALIPHAASQRPRSLHGPLDDDNSIAAHPAPPPARRLRSTGSSGHARFARRPEPPNSLT